MILPTLRVHVLKIWVFGILVLGIIVQVLGKYMGGCQNHGPFLGTLNIRGRIIVGIQKRTIILTTIHMIIGYLDP